MSKQPSTRMVSIVGAWVVSAILVASCARIAYAGTEHGAPELTPPDDKARAVNHALERAELPQLAPPELQPRVTVVESAPARRVIGSVSMPKGSPWCNGRPTYWLVGHDNTPETPWCQQADGGWIQPRIAVLDETDVLNATDGKTRIDRHDCAAIDVNEDELLDLVCVVGAKKGKGLGFNELYLTEPNGQLRKIMKDHGLHQYPSMRARFVVALDAADGGKLLFISTRGAPRDDGKTNAHRLFRKAPTNRDDVTVTHFHEVDPDGPWVLEYKVSLALAADLNHDGIPDLIVGDENGSTHFFVQSESLSWRAINLGDLKSTRADWTNARVTDMTGDGIADLIVVGPTKPTRRSAPYLRLFAGNPDLPFLFDFEKPLFEYHPRFDAVDVEVLDANRDGILDLYLTQSDQSKGTYCGPKFKPQDWWKNGAQPPADFVPPTDMAQDVLFVGSKDAARFTPLRLEHALPGCGGLLKPWSNHALILAQGNFTQPGYNLLLEW